MVKCYDCNGSGMAKNGITMFESCKTCGGWGILNPPKAEQVNHKRKHRK
jgi:DnaJ-class molecular chaperone